MSIDPSARVYMELVALASGGRSTDTPGVAETTVAALRACRVFGFRAEDYLALYGDIDAYLTRVAGLPTIGERGGEPLSDDDHARLLDSTAALCARLPVPRTDVLPFRFSWLGFGGGIRATKGAMEVLGLEADRYEEAITAGIVVVGEDDGSITSFLCSLLINDSRPAPGINPILGVGILQIAVMGEWQATETPWAWVLRSLLDAINEKRVVTLEQDRRSFSMRRALDKARQKRALRGWVPPPFYTVTLRSSLTISGMEESPAPRAPAHTPSHRYDVRAHERVLVRRGPLPLDERTAKRLGKRGWRVYCGPLDEWATERTRVRGMSGKREGEWMAVLAARVSAHQRGPLDVPYVPAVRRVNLEGP